MFADDTVSRRHAELRLHDGRWMLRDLGSSNGTWVNGRRVMEAEVAPGRRAAARRLRAAALGGSALRAPCAWPRARRSRIRTASMRFSRTDSTRIE